MKELIENIYTIVDECGVDSCDIDMLVRIGKGNLFDCTNCIFKVAENIKYEGCPYDWVDKDGLLK